jgi:exosortase A
MRPPHYLDSALPAVATRTTHWRASLAALLLVLAVLGLLFAASFASMEAIWRRSDTFTLGYAILPISLWLAWRARVPLSALMPVTDTRALWVVALCGLLWLVARASDVLVVEQLAAVAMIPALVWAVLGAHIVRQCLFPLGFLFFAVPMGEALTSPLMNYTADFTVAAVRLSGIPVHREGNFFVLPTGSWSVVEACSGLRYLIASVTMGTLYAYLTYRSLTRRVLFVGAALLVPIVANWLRAYLIVMIGHYSGMQLAAGVDHLLYGWVFFGVVMLILIVIGGLWREDQGESRVEALASAPQEVPVRTTGPVLLTALALLAAFPAWALHMERASVAHAVLIEAPTLAWQAVPAFTDWQPRYLGMDASVSQSYRLTGKPVGLYLAYYAAQHQGTELVNSANVLVVQKDARWQRVCQDEDVARQGGHQLVEACLRSPSQRLLVWRWYWVDGQHTTSALRAKWIEARSKLMGRASPAAAIVLYTEQDASLDEARARLATFLQESGAAIEQALIHAGGGT